jgi:hypothetical protein
MYHPLYYPHINYSLSPQHNSYPNFQDAQHRQQSPVYAGKTYRYDYKDGNVFIIDFLDSNLRCEKGIAGQHKGHKGYYEFKYVEIAPCVYFMYWLEEVYTVSQIADFNRMVVYTHYTFDKMGVRKSLFHSGIITQIDKTLHCNPNSLFY